ncbi:LysR family transcriptional regulator [Azorhizophilus paspali]|uniref:LysR family transcriptional regulator n=1 Tax=Azorhizophilus paspali TaxID=69963 RepID=A0ABV6SKN7_AZOPA
MFKKLEIFLAFMRSGNLSRAAAELDTSKVSVHRALHSLENALRCPLFKREGRELTPLESAHVLEERTQKLVADVLDTVRPTREAANSLLADQAEVNLAALREATFITLTQGLTTHQDALRVFRQAGFAPKVASRSTTSSACSAWSAPGVAYALLPGRIATVYENRIRLIPLETHYRLQQQIGVVLLKSRERNPKLLALLAECRMYAKRHAG